jgi:hypothetical protein
VLSKAPTEFGRTTLLAHRASRASILVAARPLPSGQGARPERSGAGPGSGVDQVGQVSRLIPLGIAETERGDAASPGARIRCQVSGTTLGYGSPGGINNFGFCRQLVTPAVIGLDSSKILSPGMSSHGLNETSIALPPGIEASTRWDTLYAKLV